MKKVRIIFPDINGAIRGKFVPEEMLEDSRAIRMPKSVLAQDIEGEETGALKDYDISTGDRDMQLIPDKDTLVELPYEPTYKNMIADLYKPDGEAIEIAPRYILKNAIKALKDLGIEAKVTTEIEFYITNDDGSQLTDNQAVKPYGDLTAIEGIRGIIDDTLAAIDASGLKVEGILNEAGAGQFELNVMPDDPLSMADKTLYFKQSLRDIAAKHGKAVSFLAKPYIYDSGSSQHIHISLWKDNKNLCVEDKKITDSFLAGLIVHSHDTFVLNLPNPNSYRRLALGHDYVPKFPTFGEDDRTVAFRYTGNNNNRHIESRIAGADSNGYLIIAGILFAGADGIKSKLSLDSEEIKSAMTKPFAVNLRSAVLELKRSEWVEEKFGRDFIDMFVGIKNSELTKFSKQITAWETKVYGSQL